MGQLKNTRLKNTLRIVVLVLGLWYFYVNIAKWVNVNNDNVACFDSLSDASRHPRFGHLEFPTIISTNLIGKKHSFSWSPMQTQVSGHGINSSMENKGMTGMLLATKGKILKRVQENDQFKGMTEVAFYSHMMKSDDPIDKKYEYSFLSFSESSNWKLKTRERILQAIFLFWKILRMVMGYQV